MYVFSGVFQQGQQVGAFCEAKRCLGFWPPCRGKKSEHTHPHPHPHAPTHTHTHTDAQMTKTWGSSHTSTLPEPRRSNKTCTTTCHIGIGTPARTHAHALLLLPAPARTRYLFAPTSISAVLVLVFVTDHEAISSSCTRTPTHTPTHPHTHAPTHPHTIFSRVVGLFFDEECLFDKGLYLDTLDMFSLYTTDLRVENQVRRRFDLSFVLVYIGLSRSLQSSHVACVLVSSADR